VYARYRSPIQSIGRWKVTAWDVPLSMPGATTRYVDLNPGDFVFADDDGALVIPAAPVSEVLERAEAIDAEERDIRRDLAGGPFTGRRADQVWPCLASVAHAGRVTSRSTSWRADAVLGLVRRQTQVRLSLLLRATRASPDRPNSVTDTPPPERTRVRCRRRAST
jgi:hypothetical protein